MFDDSNSLPTLIGVDLRDEHKMRGSDVNLLGKKGRKSWLLRFIFFLFLGRKQQEVHPAIVFIKKNIYLTLVFF
jgi:hypothetical protein